MRSARGLCLVAGALSVVGPAHAGDEAEPVLATIASSSSKQAVEHAFDGIAETSWCPTGADKVGALVTAFPRPVQLKSLTLYAGKMDMRHLTDGWYRPTPIEVTAGDTSIQIVPREAGQGPLPVERFKGKVVDKLVLRLPPASSHDQRCLAEVDIELEGGPWFFGLSTDAVAALPKDVKAATEALRTCDPVALKQVARFPLDRRELQAGFAGAEKHLAPGRPKKYGRPESLAKHCRELVFAAGDKREPVAIRSLAADVVRVEANRGGGVVYWRMVWNGSRWELSAIESYSFE